jgi:hypothetical protein
MPLITDAARSLSEPADGKIIKKKQRLGTLNDDIVDAHGHQIDAHGVVFVHHEGDLELGAHTVGGTHQHGLAHPFEY